MTFRAQVLAALKWTVIGRAGTQLVSWAITIVVMRLLTPGDYGLIAMATLFSGLCAVVAEIGMGSSITQSSDITPRQVRQVYAIVVLSNLGIVLLLAAVAAPLAAMFFAEPRVDALICVVALQFVPAVFSVIPSAMLDRDMQYRGRAAVDFVSTLFGALLTLALAYLDQGAFALAWGTVATAALRAAGLNWIKPYREWPLFEFSGVGRMLRFGRDVAANRLVFYLYSQADSFIVGKLLGKHDLGLYSVSMNLASMPASRMAVTIDQVAFPALSKIKREGGDVSRYVLASLRSASLLAFPVMWGMSSVAPELVHTLLGETWAASVTPLALLCLIMPLRVLSPIVHASLQSIGQANVSFRNTATTAVVMCLAFVVGCQYGLIGLALSWTVVFPLVFLFNLARTAPCLNLTLGRILGALVRPLLAAGIMVGAVAGTRGLLSLPALPALCILVAAGVASYVAASLLLNKEGLAEAWRQLRPAGGQP
jgi:O-antigen/teichoic acid export membrane protein